MFNFMVTADGGLTTAGYAITIIAGIILFFLAKSISCSILTTHPQLADVFSNSNYLSLIVTA